MNFDSDIALAQACAAGDEEALARFDKHVIKRVQKELVRRFGHDSAEEFIQQTRTRLLVAVPGTSPKIATYKGTAPLSAWVRTVAIRIAIDATDTAPTVGLTEDLSLSPDLELKEQARRFAPYFEQAFRTAVKLLTRRERVALRMLMIDKLSNEKIAAVFHVHPSSMSRLLAQARGHIRENTFIELQKLLGMSKTSVASVARAYSAQWHLSLGRCLKEDVPA